MVRTSSLLIGAAALALPLAEAFTSPAMARLPLRTAAMSKASFGRPVLAARKMAASSISMEFAAPPAVYEAIVAAGETKAKMPAWKIFYMGLLAGAYISFGSCLAISIGGACQGIVAAGNLGVQKMIFGAFGLPVGLLMVVVCGGELFTGNTAFLTAAAAEGKATPGEIAKSWIWSYMGNLVGSIAFAFLVFASGVLPAPTLATVKGMAVAKTSVAFLPLVLRGILCNWLVCIGIWQATAAKDIGSKAIAIWFPISAFVAMGFEHSVANMFFLPTALFNGADISWKMIFMNNLLPVTIGNTIAGAFLVAMSYAIVFGTPGKKINAFFEGK
eukprot:CAMPEP_0180130066 /NCGR_PEP_ID=MMETSP0986-20121125/7658_1 /TAXON_ID=697907 /ORGANISM="non described non described, Strain CCMP2293" /LENGTH=329 /DNA_ID=CAMNT_0022069791 /DNA_START=60 /DNA_END=1049 /DNA_ORIENTATION=+